MGFRSLMIYFDSKPLQNICIRMAVEKGWLQTIAQRGSATAAEVAKATGTDQAFLSKSVRAGSQLGVRPY